MIINCIFERHTSCSCQPSISPIKKQTTLQSIWIQLLLWAFWTVFPVPTNRFLWGFSVWNCCCTASNTSLLKGWIPKSFRRVAHNSVSRKHLFCSRGSRLVLFTLPSHGGFRHKYCKLSFLRVFHGSYEVYVADGQRRWRSPDVPFHSSTLHSGNFVNV